MPRALLIVDVQRDFLPGGALGVTDGDAVIAPLNALAASGDFELVVATRDWHPPEHSSFVPQGGTWPVHCVAGTPGAELGDGLDADRIDVIVDKGTVDETDGYSGFDGTALAEMLRARGIDELVIGGIATDYCVKATALDALDAGFKVTVDATLTRAVDLEAGDGEKALAAVAAAGATVRPSLDE